MLELSAQSDKYYNKKFNQAKTIMRYLGAKYGYLPKSDDEQYQCDNFCETFYDIFQVVLQSTITGQQNPAIITEAVMKIREFLKANKDRLASDKGFLFGNYLTIADFWLGAVYVNVASNAILACGRSQWIALLQAEPDFAAYGQRFSQANAVYLRQRSPSPF